jgi:hypothetical protein
MCKMFAMPRSHMEFESDDGDGDGDEMPVVSEGNISSWDLVDDDKDNNIVIVD